MYKDHFLDFINCPFLERLSSSQKVKDYLSIDSATDNAEAVQQDILHTLGFCLEVYPESLAHTIYVALLLNLTN